MVFIELGSMKKLLKKALMRTGIMLLLAGPLGVNNLCANTIKVNSLAELQTAINKAVPGTEILLANGVYTSTEDIGITCKGTQRMPVIIAAETNGGAEISGEGGFVLQSPATYVIIRGFKFTHKANHAKAAAGTSFCRWTRNVFETPGDGEYLMLAGSDHQVDYNTFQHKNSMGRFIAVRGAGSQIAERLWIHHNYFLDQKRKEGNGIETLQFGLSGYSLSSSNSVVEYNLFEECNGENEMISVKSSAVTLRYNTIRNCPAQFTLRHGNHCLVYGNYFVNTPGLRIFGDDHAVFSNYFENCSLAINIGNGGAEVADGAKLTSHDRPDRVLIAYNTMVNNKQNITQTPRKDGIGATYITVVNNVIYGGPEAATIKGPYTNGVWKGNIIFNTKGAGEMPDSGYVVKDPLLVKDATGTYHLAVKSPAIGAGKGSYVAVTVDMDGQPRSLSPDAGADQVSREPVLARILTPAAVGAAAP